MKKRGRAITHLIDISIFSELTALRASGGDIDAWHVIAREILLEGELFGAERAKEVGFVNRIVADADVEAEAYATADRISRGAPIAAQLNKKFIRRLTQPEPITQAEHDETYISVETEDFKTGIESFLAKKRPDFKGR